MDTNRAIQISCHKDYTKRKVQCTLTNVLIVESKHSILEKGLGLEILARKFSKKYLYLLSPLPNLGLTVEKKPKSIEVMIVVELRCNNFTCNSAEMSLCATFS